MSQLNLETKFYILFAAYVGAWAILPGLTPKLVALDLTWLGLGVLAFSVGAFMHAITFPCTDVVAEVWGAKKARVLVYIGFSVYVIATGFYVLATVLPPAPDWPHDDAYGVVFSQAWRIVLGAVAATIVAQLLDIFLFEKIKQRTGQNNLWLRNTGSTAISQLSDTVIFYSIAFYGLIPNEVFPFLILGTYLVKLLITFCLTPVVYLLVYWVTGQWSTKVLE